MAAGGVGLDLGQPRGLIRCGQERAFEAVSGEAGQLGPVEAHRGGQLTIVLVHKAAEIGRVVAVQGHVQAAPQHLGHGMVLQIHDYAELQV